MWTYNYAGYSDELYHHGVKGMKWGVRKKEGLLSRVRKFYSAEGVSDSDLSRNRASSAYENREKIAGTKAAIKSKKAELEKARADDTIKSMNDPWASDSYDRRVKIQQIKDDISLLEKTQKRYERYRVNDVVTKESVARGRKFTTATLAGIGALSVLAIKVQMEKH